LPNFGEYGHVFAVKVIGKLGPMPVNGFSLTIIAKAVLKG
jgi:hypothetical protein